MVALSQQKSDLSGVSRLQDDARVPIQRAEGGNQTNKILTTFFIRVTLFFPFFPFN